MVRDYELIVANGAAVLDAKVRDAVNMGFSPIGSPVVLEGGFIGQAMILERRLLSLAILHDRFPAKLEDQIHEKLREGWELDGPLIVFETLLIQKMVLRT